MNLSRRTLHEMNLRLFTKAVFASRLAKCAKGWDRDRLYGLKDNALNQLIRKADSPEVHVDVDRERFPGLLSVRFDGVGALHTHEGWLGRTELVALSPKPGRTQTRRPAASRRIDAGTSRRNPRREVEEATSRPTARRR